MMWKCKGGCKRVANERVDAKKGDGKGGIMIRVLKGRMHYDVQNKRVDTKRGAL